MIVPEFEFKGRLQLLVNQIQANMSLSKGAYSYSVSTCIFMPPSLLLLFLGDGPETKALKQHVSELIERLLQGSAVSYLLILSVEKISPPLLCYCVLCAIAVMYISFFRSKAMGAR